MWPFQFTTCIIILLYVLEIHEFIMNETWENAIQKQEQNINRTKQILVQLI